MQHHATENDAGSELARCACASQNIAVYMVRFFEGHHASEQSVSRLTGILAASLPAAQFLTSFFWGRFSDRVGRKPVMLVGNVSGALSMLALGWSPIYIAALLSRFIGGLFNGTSVYVLTSTLHWLDLFVDVVAQCNART